ncbi:hypothetical protein SteCoe_35237 [Stentor coeruleus]|uniref:Uncharacterized protein n=1 Tax=Stentor coeruleus TaxID=5963 RepID=A0A1R2ASR2_9CILI|nr:hypothetical protein SteCoe_35237 [Stentor coeruleus]
MSEEEYNDITERFLSACQHLNYGEIVALPDFSYLESMSAVELLDSRLDSGLALLTHLPIDIPSVFSPQQYLGILDTFLLHLAMWLEGQSLTHTFYSSIFFHIPSGNDILIKAILTSSIYFSETLHKLIHSTACLREDDYAYVSLNFEGININETEGLLLKAEKTVENEEVLVRLKFIRGLYGVVHNILKPDGINCADTLLSFALKQFEIIKDLKTEEVSGFYNKNNCLKKLPHFLPNKIYEPGNYNGQKALLRISNFLKSFEYLIKLKDVADLDELFDKLSTMPSFDIFSRTIYESMLFTQQTSEILLFGKFPLNQMLVRSMDRFGVDTNFFNLQEEFYYYISRVEIVFKEYILLKLKNKARQQRILAKYLSDFNILVSESHYLVEKVYGKSSTKPEKQLLFQWIFYKTAWAMIDYLKLSFELQLYNDKDISMIMFYMDFLYGVVYSILCTQSQYLNLKQNKKKKKKFDAKTNEIELKYAFAHQSLCRGIVRIIILLNYTNNIPINEEQEAIRFQKRFRVFKAVQMPQLIEYQSFAPIKKIPEGTNFEDFANGCKDCFDLARKTLSELEGIKPVKGLMRVCVKNLLALSKAKKLEWKGKVSYDFNEDKIFPVVVVDENA